MTACDRPTGRLPGLDVLRAGAIVWVMLFHAYLVGGLGPRFEWLSRFGWAGVDLFFVLSGFLIGTQVLRSLQDDGRCSFAAFYARRAWRIVPAYAVVLAVYVAFPALREAPGLAPWWQFATFGVNLLIDYTHDQAFSHAWSLCVEEHFYLVFPWLASWTVRRRSARRFALMSGALIAAGIALRGGVWLHDAALDPPRNWFIEDLYYPSWMRLDGLLAGVVLAALRVHRPLRWERMQRHGAAFLVAGLATSAVALWLFRDRTGLLANAIGWPVLSWGFGLLLVAACSPAVGGRWRVPGARWIATVSYSLYLSHKLAFHAVECFVAPRLEGHGVLLFATYGIASLGLGAILHRGIERPFLRWRDRHVRSRPPGGGALA